MTTNMVQITARPHGGGQILLDGQDISNSVKAITIDVTGNAPPRVLLVLMANVEFEGEGVEVTSRG